MADSESSGKAVEILLVEDNPGDVRLTREVLGQNKIRSRLFVVESGHGAMAYLRREGAYADAVRPDLILLDLNLPGKDGREALAEIKTDPALKAIPVIVLTSSSAEADIAKTYEIHGNCYVVKPVDLEQFTKVVQSIGEFWFTVVKLPLPDPDAA